MMYNKRLKFISQLFKEATIYDIGSDHGYLVKYLFDDNKITEANIIEVNEMPLLNAKNSLKDYNNITYYLSDGLSKINEVKDNSGIVIAGMGGSLIAKILENDLNKFYNSTLYLQPNNNEDILRGYLQDNNFSISNEYVINDNNKFYCILVCKKGNMNLKEYEINYGFNVELSYDHKMYLNFKQKKLEKINEQLQKNKKDNSIIETQLEYLKKKLGEYEN